MVHGRPFEPTDYTRWYSTSTTDHGTTFELGSITYGQSKDLLIPLHHRSASARKLTLTYDTVGSKKKSLEFGVKKATEQADLDLITRHKFRLEFVHCVRSTCEKMSDKKTTSTNEAKRRKETTNEIKELEKEMKKYTDKNDEFIKDLLADLTGQVNEAVGRKDWFMKWGIHFLPSLTRKFDRLWNF